MIEASTIRILFPSFESELVKEIAAYTILKTYNEGDML